MIDLDPRPDEALRGRLLELAEREGAGLSEPARQRAMSATLASATSASSRWRAALWAGPLAIAAAVALALLGRGAQPGPAPSLPAAQQETVACALGSALTRAELTSEAEGGRVLSIGEHARVLASAGTRIATRLSAPCRAQVVLDGGTLRVHARALDGGELSVVSAWGEVVVRGTVFAVRSDDAGLDVALAEGRVSIERVGSQALAMEAGERVQVRDGEVSRSALSDVEARELLAAFDLVAPSAASAAADARAQTPATAATKPAEPLQGGATARAATAKTRPRSLAAADGPHAEAAARTEPAASADDLVISADDARKAGDLDRARQLYRKAGAEPGRAAEAAWLRLAQLELDGGRLDAARAALAEHERRFARGALGAEAAWLRVRLAQRAGDRDALRDAAERLVERHPSSPQARAARRILSDETR